MSSILHIDMVWVLSPNFISGKELNASKSESCDSNPIIPLSEWVSKQFVDNFSNLKKNSNNE